MPTDKINVVNINPPMPIINLNGTDGTTLLSEWVIARNAVEAALNAAAAVTLHGRDFQTHSLKAAFNIAAEHHAKRLRMLVLVRDEIEAICLNLQNQLEEREDRGFHERQAARHAAQDEEPDRGMSHGLKLRKGETVVVSDEERFPKSDWRYEIANGDTNLGYVAWLAAKREAESDDNMRETLLGIIAVCDMADATRNETTTVDGLLKTIRNIGSMASDTLKAVLLKDGEPAAPKPRELHVDGTVDGTFQTCLLPWPQAKPPFVVFDADADAQSVIAGPFLAWADAEAHRVAILHGAEPRFDEALLRAQIDAIDNAKE